MSERHVNAIEPMCRIVSLPQVQDCAKNVQHGYCPQCPHIVLGKNVPQRICNGFLNVFSLFDSDLGIATAFLFTMLDRQKLIEKAYN